MKEKKRLLTKVLRYVFTFVCFWGPIIYAKEVTDVGQIKVIQAILNFQGYDCGAVDGVPGKKTVAAIGKYEKAQGMNVTGKISDELISGLGIDQETLNGVYIDDFVNRYNQAVTYLNDVSSKTGDPTISAISKDQIVTEKAILDNATTISIGYDDNNIIVCSISLQREGNTYDMQMAYELVSCVYAIDSSFTDVKAVAKEIDDYLEKHTYQTNKMKYDMINVSGAIVFLISAI